MGGASNTPITVAYEGLGAAANVTLSSTANDVVDAADVPVSYSLGQNLTNGNLFHITLGGGINFPAAETLYLCTNSTSSSNKSAAINVGYGTPAVGATEFNIQATANVTANSLVYLSSVSCNSLSPNVVLNVPANTSVGGSYTISGAVWSSGGIVIDSSAAANAVQVVKEFTSTLSASDLITIDYLNTTNGSSDGTRIVASNGSGNLIAASLNKIYVAITTVNVPASANFTQSVSLMDSASWKGVSKIFTTTNSDCTGTVVAANNAPSGTVSLSPTAAFAANLTSADSKNTTICIQVSGNTPLDARTITGSYSYAASSTGIAPAGQSNQTFQIWNVNAYQAFNPYMYVGTTDQTVDVFNRFYNNSTQTASVSVEVFPADGSASQTLSLGTIPPNEAGLYWGSTIGTAAGLAQGTSYAARFTITAPPSMVNGVSFFKRSGGERQMPLYKAAGSTYLMQ
jgi:hypothetical protein